MTVAKNAREIGKRVTENAREGVLRAYMVIVVIFIITMDLGILFSPLPLLLGVTWTLFFTAFVTVGMFMVAALLAKAVEWVIHGFMGK